MTDFTYKGELTPVPQEYLEKWKNDTNLPNMPTTLTYHLRLGITGLGDYAEDWVNNPHILVYEACREIERLNALVEILNLPKND